MKTWVRVRVLTLTYRVARVANSSPKLYLILYTMSVEFEVKLDRTDMR